MFKLKLIKGLSYSGIVSATSKNPYVTVDNEETALAAVETGYFKIVERSENIPDEKTGKINDGESKDWKKLNKDDLIAFANEHNIDVSSCKNQDERIAIIEAALANEDGTIDDLFNS